MSHPVDIDPKEYMATLQTLKQVDFLQGIPDENLKGVLFYLKKQAFTSNKTILFQGEIANQLFIIKRGGVVITTKNKGVKLQLAELTAPMYFGEISLLTPTSATATVKASDDGADLLILTHEGMSQLMTKKVPDIKERIQRVINQRIESKKKAKEADDLA